VAISAASRSRTIASDQIDKMLIDNPRRHFEGAAERYAPKAVRVDRFTATGFLSAGFHAT
jgi:hypothetical protein